MNNSNNLTYGSGWGYSDKVYGQVCGGSFTGIISEETELYHTSEFIKFVIKLDTPITISNRIYSKKVVLTSDTFTEQDFIRKYIPLPTFVFKLVKYTNGIPEIVTVEVSSANTLKEAIISVNKTECANNAHSFLYDEDGNIIVYQL